MRTSPRGTPLTDGHAGSATQSLLIVNPFRGGGLPGMFRTPTRPDERVRRVEAIGRPTLTSTEAPPTGRGPGSWSRGHAMSVDALAEGARQLSAGLAGVVAIQHVIYGLSGGVHPDVWIRTALVLGTIAATGLLLVPTGRWPATTLPALVLLWLPFAVTYPIALVSPAGLAYVFLAALTSLAILATMVLEAAAASPDDTGLE